MRSKPTSREWVTVTQPTSLAPAPVDQHLTFGFGLHSCLGATLARAAIAEAITALSERTVSWQLVGEPERGPMASGGAPCTLPLEFTLGRRRQDAPRVLGNEDW
jgi:cytochrome P450